MTDIRHDEPCSSPSSVSGLVDTATLAERLRELASFLLRPPRSTTTNEWARLVSEAAAALSALEKRPSIGFVQSLADANADLLARAVDAEAREKALIDALRPFTNWRDWPWDKFIAWLDQGDVDEARAALAAGVRGHGKEGQTPTVYLSGTSEVHEAGDAQSASSGGEAE